MNEISKDLRDTQAKLLEVIPRRANARAVLSRVVIRSPYNGRVVGLNCVFDRWRHQSRRKNSRHVPKKTR